MKTKFHSTKLILTGSICGLLAIANFTSSAQTSRSSRDARPSRSPAAKVEALAEARSPDDALRAGLEYLLAQQHSDGGWGQGGGWRQAATGGRVEGTANDEPSDLGNTCVSLVALVRSGETSAPGKSRGAMLKALDFICAAVESADKDSLFVTQVRDTQLQVKIGTYVDTFLAGWALSEVKDHGAGEAIEKRRTVALEKVVSKIERNQKDDGSFEGNKGWAAVLSQGLASKALNLASRSGAKVSNQALDKDNRQNGAGLDLAKGEFSAPVAAAEPSSAGVSLYREAAKLGGLREKTKSNVKRKDAAEKIAADPQAPAPVKAQAQQELKQIDADEKAAQVAAKAVSGKLRDSSYVAGFGNNGGEEFLSYLNLTESMHERGGQDWTDWRAKMTKTLCGAQNQDGSWAGNHCITGRTFCTAGALLTLLVERAAEKSKTTSLSPGLHQSVANK
ncbi:MAG: prenyltransferase/squalene oxidase repeat-containing protein [Chthoniobacteraceae bacterium]